MPTRPLFLIAKTLFAFLSSATTSFSFLWNLLILLREM